MATVFRALVNKISDFNNLKSRIIYGKGPLGKTMFSQQSPVTEQQIQQILTKKFPTATNITVEDVSGGCGAMFNIFVETADFKGLSIVKQHRSVYDTLKEQIKNIHGLHVETRTPK